MKYLLDTGPLAALLNKRESSALRAWALNTLPGLPWPLLTCEPVLTEAAHFLGTFRPLLEMVAAGELVVDMDVTSQAADLLRIREQYQDRRISLADACLVRMAELFRQSTVVTIDRQDFTVYRRFGREAIPFLAPPV
jgi:uncharacterized protein